MPAHFAIFWISWVILGAGSWIFYSKASYETKKNAHPFIVIGMGIIFVAFAGWATHTNLPWYFVLFLALILYLNIRNTQFCPQCNATIYGRFTRSDFCPKCGTQLR